MRRPSPLGAVTLAAAVLLSACGGAAPAGSAGDDGRLEIATTVSPITSIVSAVVGDRARVRGIVPEGTNSHTYEPQPSVARILADADVVFVNGLRLDEPTIELAKANVRDDVDVVALGDHTLTPDQYLYDFSFPESGGKPNPHLWTDPILARRYAQIVADTVSALDPANAEVYGQNAAAFEQRIDQLDTAMRAAFSTIPGGRRQLLTYHDAYAYFAEDYGWRVIGAIQMSDFEDPTPRDVAKLIEQVKAEDVRAIFGSEVFPSPVLAEIAKETGATYVDDLRDDDLPGSPGDPEHSWLGLMRFNYATITGALGGDPSAILAVDVTPAAPDVAEYPQ